MADIAIHNVVKVEMIVKELINTSNGIPFHVIDIYTTNDKGHRDCVTFFSDNKLVIETN